MPRLKNLEVENPMAGAVEPIAPGQPSEVCQMLIDDAPLLKSEDKRRYQLIYRTVVDELKAA